MKLYYRLRNKVVRSVSRWTIRKTVITAVALVVVVVAGTRSLHYIEQRHWDNRLGELFEPLIPATYIPNITNLLTPWRYLLPSGLPSYRLEIAADDLKKLEAAIPKGFDSELSDDATWVPATFHAEGKDYKVKVRNRGLLPSHWKYRQKSWRVRFTKDLFHGYEELNFIIPEEKGFLAEQFGYHVAQKLGLITVDSSFVRLKINRQQTGVYWMVEQWDAGFLERHELSSDANFYSGETDGIFLDAAAWETDASQPGWADHNAADLDLLISCLNACSDAEFSAMASRLIDLENFARWQAQATIMGDDHQDYFHNNRFYFDPTRGTFMFFPWDVNQFKFKGEIDIHYNPLMSRLLTIPEVRNRRNQLVWEYVSNEQTIADDLAYYQTLWQETKSAFYRDRMKRFSNWFVNNQVEDRYQKIIGQYQYLRDVLTGTNEAPTPVKLMVNKNQPVSLVVTMSQFSDLVLRGISVKGNLAASRLFFDANANGTLDQSDWTLGGFTAAGERSQVSGFELMLSTKRQIPDKIERALGLLPTDYRFFIVGQSLPNLQPDDFSFDLVNAVTKQAAPTAVTFYDFTSFQYLDDIDQPVDQFLAQHSLFQRTNGNELYLGAGTHRLTETVIVPKGTKLTIAPGATLLFDAGVSLISYSPIEASGTTDRPITFAPGGNQPWGVVAVIEADSTTFRYCRFTNGKDALINGAYFSGMLSSYHTDLTLEGCTIEGAQADDGVNVKFAQATIKNSIFRRQSSDALDLDFVSGTVSGNSFLENGNDGIDLSGSEVRIENNVMRGSGDKGVSVGEASKPVIVNNLIINGNIGIEVKDLSEATIGNVTIVGNKVGLNAYRKKEIFGGGYGRVYNSIIWNNEAAVEHDEFSSSEISSSVVAGGFGGRGVVDLDPQFRDVAGFNYAVGNGALGQTFDAAAATQYGWSGAATIGADPSRLPRL